MRKLYLLIFAFVLLTAAAVQAQGFYVIKGENSSDNAYRPGSTGFQTLIGNTSNDKMVQQFLSFPFSFNGESFNSYYVSDNGYITFQKKKNLVSIPANTTLPSASAPDSSIFGFWADLELKAALTSRVISWTSGSSGNRMHVVMWEAANLKGRASTDSMGFAIVLYEKGGFDVVYLYGKLPAGAKGTAGYQFNASKGLMLSGSPNFSFPNVNSDVNNRLDDEVYSFLPGAQLTYDVMGLAVLPVKRFNSVNVPANLLIAVQNRGSAVITSADINYQINNGAVITKNVTGLNIQPYGEGKDTILHTDAWTPNTVGITQIKMWLTNLNGNADQNPDNDTAITTRQVLANWGSRRVFIEEFTNVSSKDAGTHNPNFNKVLDRNIELLSVIKYHTYWPGDDPMNDYSKAEVSKRVNFYTISIIPNVKIDGKGAAGSFPFGSPANVSDAAVDKAVAVDPGFHIKASTSNSGATYNFNVDLTSYINTANAVLFAAIVEDDIAFAKPPGINGEKVFSHVMRKMLPDADGTSIGDINQWHTRNIQLSYTPDNIVKTNNLRFVAWVQDKNNGEVHNSFWTEPNFVPVLVNGVDEYQSPSAILNTIYPNPTNGLTNIRFSMEVKGNVNIVVSDMLGRNVRTVAANTSYQPGEYNLQFDASSLNKGIYFVSINVNGQSSARKLIVN